MLENLLSMRDQMAQKRDCPHFKILGNNTVLEIVRRKPLDKRGLTGIPGLSPKLIGLMGDVIVEMVRKGLELPGSALEPFPKKTVRRLMAKETSRIKALKKWRDRIGEKRGIDPSLVCTNAQIQALAIANPKEPEEMEEIREIRKWQVEIFGPGICDVLQDAG